MAPNDAGQETTHGLNFHVAERNGRYLLVGDFMPSSAVKVGQLWANVDASELVAIIDKNKDWVTYEGQHVSRLTKLYLDFQRDYRLVLPSDNIPATFSQ